MHNRRDFLKISAMAGGALMLPQFAQRARAAFFQTQALQKFVAAAAHLRRRHSGVRAGHDDLPWGGFPPDRDEGVLRHNSIRACRPRCSGATARPGSTFKHLGGAIIAQKNTPVRVRWTNNLPNVHPLPVDMSVITPYGVGPGIEVNRAAPHLHGGLVPWPSDGGPFHWFSSTLGGAKVVGPSVMNWLPDPAPAAR